LFLRHNLQKTEILTSSGASACDVIVCHIFTVKYFTNQISHREVEKLDDGIIDPLFLRIRISSRRVTECGKLESKSHSFPEYDKSRRRF
jgi:hypothetical protein